MIDWDRWGGEPPDCYQIAMLVVLSVTLIMLVAMLSGLVDIPGSGPVPKTDTCESKPSALSSGHNRSSTPKNLSDFENVSVRCDADLQTAKLVLSSTRLLHRPRYSDTKVG